MSASELIEGVTELPTSVKTKIVEVTPDMARFFLEYNKENRRLRPMKIKEHGKALRDGNWLLTHQGVAFDESGRLVDGQHRLHAIAETGISAPMMVTWNLPTGSMDGIDRGAMRAIGDILRLEHGVEDGTRVAPICAVLREVVERTKVKPSVVETLDVYRKYHDGIRWAIGEFPAKGSKLTRSAFMAGFAYGYLAQPEHVARFVEDYRDGICPEKYHPPKKLREYALQTDRRAVAPRDLFYLTTTALFRHFEGRTMVNMASGRAGFNHFASIVEKKGGAE